MVTNCGRLEPVCSEPCNNASHGSQYEVTFWDDSYQDESRVPREGLDWLYCYAAYDQVHGKEKRLSCSGVPASPEQETHNAVDWLYDVSAYCNACHPSH